MPRPANLIPQAQRALVILCGGLTTDSTGRTLPEVRRAAEVDCSTPTTLTIHQAHGEARERWKRYSDRWGRYMEQGGVDRLGEQFSVLISNAGEAANAVFDTPADALPGAIKKLKIAYMVTGDSEGAGNGDATLDVYQVEDPWMPKVIRDLERLAGEG